MAFAVFPSESSDESLEELSLIRQCGKVPVTNCALEWFLSCMDPQMVLQVSWSWEALATLHALELFLSIVIPFMNRDVEKLLRLQWFFPSWILLWYFFVFWSWEALATLCAIEWLLSCVTPFINLHLMWKSSCHFCCTSMVVSFQDLLMVLQVSW